MRNLLQERQDWEKRIKDECLRLIREQKDLNSINMDEITNKLIAEGVATIPNDVEQYIEKMISDKLQSSQHYQKFIKDI